MMRRVVLLVSTAIVLLSLPGVRPGRTAGFFDGGSVFAQAGASKQSPTAKPAPSKPVKRTRREVLALIKEASRTKPEWWDSVALTYPQTLNLSWPQPKGPWAPSKVPGQYMYSIVGPNRGKWKSGIKLMHHIISINKNNRDACRKATTWLGNSYYDFLQDYARAAFWYRKDNSLKSRIKAASCYWKLGCRSMAEAELKKIRTDLTHNGAAIRLWGEMGNLKRATAMADRLARLGRPIVAYMAAGDVCRAAGKFDGAIKYYQRVLRLTSTARHLPKQKKIARDRIAAVKIFDKLDLSKVADGTYTGSSEAFRGAVDLRVVVAGGKIESVMVTRNREDYPGISLTEIPKRIVEVQGVKGVDAVTSATVTSIAIINATAKALANGMR